MKLKRLGLQLEDAESEGIKTGVLEGLETLTSPTRVTYEINCLII